MFDHDPRDPITELPFGLNGRLYRGAMPYSLFDPRGAVLDAAGRAGVDVVVLLAEAAECVAQTDRDLVALYEARGWTVIHAPIVDQSVPRAEARPAFCTSVHQATAFAEAGRHVLVHCLAGVGRTGTFLACLARVVRGLEPDAAIAWVREYVPGAVEREEQARFVREVEL
jgi:protein-tyrosine phosphatase